MRRCDDATMRRCDDATMRDPDRDDHLREIAGREALAIVVESLDVTDGEGIKTVGGADIRLQ
jgi:hypothetical protein